MTRSKKAVSFFGILVSIGIGGAMPTFAADCASFPALSKTVHDELEWYVELLHQKSASEREICAAMKRLFRDADVMLKSDYASCIPKQYTPWVVEVGASVQDFKKDDFNAFKCSRYP
jgi:hypothetical protein